MLSEEFLRDSRKRFAIVGPPVSEAEIVALFPVPFPGRNDLVQFYSNTNGGSRTPQGCLIHCGNPAHKTSRDRLHEIRIEGFFSISRDAADKMLPFAPMLRHYASAVTTFGQIPEVKVFLAHHKPIAFDHSGNDIWIDLESGYVRFVDWDTYKEGPIEIAPSFHEFGTRFWVDAVLPELD
jgi:SMI1 / KNR4 family (SUKH-1)